MNPDERIPLSSAFESSAQAIVSSEVPDIADVEISGIAGHDVLQTLPALSGEFEFDGDGFFGHRA